MSFVGTPYCVNVDTPDGNHVRDSFIVEGLNELMELDSTDPNPQVSGSPITSPPLPSPQTLPVTLSRETGRGVSVIPGQLEHQWTHTNHSLTMQENAIRKLSECVEAHQTDMQRRLDYLPCQMEENQQQIVQRQKYLQDSLKQDIQGKLHRFKTQMETNHHQVILFLEDEQKRRAEESASVVKGVCSYLKEVMEDMKNSLTGELRFLIEQTQKDTVNEMEKAQKATDLQLEGLHQEVMQCFSLLDKSSAPPSGFTSATGLASKVIGTGSTTKTPLKILLNNRTPAATVMPPLERSLPIKLLFPTFGSPEDDVDPLFFLSKCNDFLSIRPLTDLEVLATLRSVLHGTARDWWEIAREHVSTWEEFQKIFLLAFLSEDYGDELAERVRNRVQGEAEPIRDFAFSYRVLCRRWKADITEQEMVKLLLKNMVPRLASQLRERVQNVDDLVRLGTQFEKDWKRHLQTKNPVPSSQYTNNSPGAKPSQIFVPKIQDKSPVMCWRCKVQHPPDSCPLYVQRQDSGKGRKGPKTESLDRRGGLHTIGSALMPTMKPLDSTASGLIPIPQQLLVPLTVRNWRGKAIIDTGASYTLMQEALWQNMALPHEELRTWEEGPLYLANGEPTTPLGWISIIIQLHGETINLPVAILADSSLAFAVVLGLDFLFFSGLTISMSEPSYRLHSDYSQPHPFQPGNALISGWSLLHYAESGQGQVRDRENIKRQRQKHVPPVKSENPTITLITAVPPLLSESKSKPDADFYIKQAVQQACLSDDERWQLSQMLDVNSEVCTLTLGRTTVFKHKIYTRHEVPIKQRPYRLSPAKLAILNEQLKSMLENGIVEPSFSGWASPVVLIPKKDGGYRFCVDYRKPNAITESDAYPLPNINDILESLAGASIFSNLDLNSGYWQVSMDPASQDKTAFVTPAGLYSFKVMPFGLKNAPATFQRLMETVLGDLRGRNCLVYLDDIIIYSSSVAEHLQDIQSVFDRLKAAGLTLNLKKCRFCLPELKFLGHVVNAEGIHADPAKVAAVQEFPIPTSLKAVQRFLGMAGWYHRFVPDFSKVAEPLNHLKKKGVKFQWTPACQGAFEALKNSLITPLVLGHPNLNAHFIVYTDASQTGLGAVLAQQTGLGTEEVLAYASRTLNSAERNYSTTERECLAVVWALEKWSYYLEAKIFTVVTDHAALQWVLASGKTNSRLIRWSIRLQKFDFIIEYRKGKLNVVPDALSRITETANVCPPLCSTYTTAKCLDDSFPLDDESVWRAQQKDAAIMAIHKSLSEEDSKSRFNDKYSIIQDKVYRKTPRGDGIHSTHYRVFIPSTLCDQIIQAYHANPMSGHLGVFKTYRRLQEVVYWPGMWVDTRKFVQQCEVCQKYKPDIGRPAGKMQQTVVNHPNEMLGIDLMGPFPPSRGTRNEFLLVVVDYYTHWVELFPLRKATASAIALILRREVFTRFGIPDQILSDRGPQFISGIYKELCTYWGVIAKLTTAYHPQTNLTERVNRTLKGMIASFVGDQHTRWDQHLPEFRFALNSAVQETSGVTPAELHLGRPLKGPMDRVLQSSNVSPDCPAFDAVQHHHTLLARVEASKTKAKQRQLRNYDKHRRDVCFPPQSRVWVRSHHLSKASKKFTAKLASRWKGPYRVVQQLGPVNYLVCLEDTGEDVRTVHVVDLKPCYPTAEELDRRQKQHLQDLFVEDSDEEDFPGFV